MMVLSRILTAEDFGVMATVMIFYGFLSLFNDAGFKNIVIQRMDDDMSELKKIYGASIAIGVASGLLMVAGSPLASLVFKDDRLTAVTAVTSVSFFFMSMSRITGSILEKRFQFKQMSCIGTLNGVLAGIVGVAMGYFGCRYWSLVAMLVLKSFLDAVVFSALARLWVPTFDFSNMRRFFGLGVYVTVHNFMSYFGGNAEKMAISRCVDTAALGFYSRSYTLLNAYIRLVPVTIGQVLYSVFGKYGDDRAKITRTYYLFSDAAFMVTAAIMGVVCVWAGEVNAAVWGSAWALSVPSLEVLSFSAIAFTQTTFTRIVFITFYAERKLMWFSALEAVFLLLGVLAGIPYGMEGIVVGYCAGTWAGAIALGTYVGRVLAPGTLSLFCRIFFGNILLGVVFAAVSCALKRFLAASCDLGVLSSLSVCIAVMGGCLAVYVCVFRRGLIRGLRAC